MPVILLTRGGKLGPWLRLISLLSECECRASEGDCSIGDAMLSIWGGEGRNEGLAREHGSLLHAIVGVDGGVILPKVGTEPGSMIGLGADTYVTVEMASGYICSGIWRVFPCPHKFTALRSSGWTWSALTGGLTEVEEV